jgi:hypothetical protein
VAGAHIEGQQVDGWHVLGRQRRRHFFGQQVAGAQVAGSQVAGAQVTGSQAAGAQQVLQRRRHFFGQQVAGAHVAGSHVAGAHVSTAQHVFGRQVRAASAFNAVPSTTAQTAMPITRMRFIRESSN